MKESKRRNVVLGLTGASILALVGVGVFGGNAIIGMNGTATEYSFQIDKNATATGDGFSVKTALGNDVGLVAQGVTAGADGMAFEKGAIIKSSAASGIKGIEKITFDVADGSQFVLAVGTNPNHLDKTYNVTADGVVNLTEKASYFSIKAENAAATLVSAKVNYDCTFVEDESVHTGSGKYTTVDNEGVIEIHDTCEKCGAILPAVVKSMDKLVGAEYSLGNGGRGVTYSFAKNEETGVWTSGNKGCGNSAYLEVTVTKSGTVKFDYTSSGEAGYDYLYVNVNTTSETGALLTCKETGVVDHAGTFSRYCEAGEKLYIIFRKDSGGNKGDDCATIKFLSSEVAYHAVSYAVNGGEAVEPSFAEGGIVVGDIPTTTKEGQYFEGWFVDEGCTIPFSKETVIENDITVYALYSDPLTITYNVNDGTEAKTVVNFQQGTVPGSIDDPVRANYYFLGWYTSPTDFAEANKYVPAAATDNVVVYARWLSVSEAHVLYGTYKGFYVSKSASVSNGYCDFSVDVDGTYSLRTGYWETYNLYGKITAVDATTGVCTTEAITGKTSAGSVMNLGDGVVAISEKGAFGNDDTYIMFKGQTEYTPTSSVTASQVTVDGVKIIYVEYPVAGGRKTIAINQTTGVITKDVTLYDLFNKKALVLGDLKSKVYGYSVTAGGVTNKYYATTTGATFTSTTDGFEGVYTNGDKTLFVSGAGIWVSSDISIGSSAITTPKYTVIAGQNAIYAKYASIYRFNYTLDTANMTFTGVEATITLTLDYGYEEGGVQKTEEQQIKSDYTTTITPASPTRDGYKFGGWYTQPNGQGTKKTSIASEVDVTLYAYWQEAVTLHVNPNNGDEAYDVSCVAGEKPSVKVTYGARVFLGWFTDEGCTQAWDGIVGESGNTIYAKWSASLAGNYVGDEIYSSYYNKCYNAGYTLTIAENGAMSGNKVSSKTVAGASSADGEKVDLATNSDKFYTFTAKDGRRFIAMHYNGLRTTNYVTDDMGLYVNVAEGETAKITYTYLGKNYRWAIKVEVTAGGNTTVYQLMAFGSYSLSADEKVVTDAHYFSGDTEIGFDELYVSGTFAANITVQDDAGNVVYTK